MELKDYLASFSIEDLRLLALRRGLNRTPAADRDRQTLIRQLTVSMEQFPSIQFAIERLNRAEVAVLRALISHKVPHSASALATVGKTSKEHIKVVLDELRLWGLLFPEGDWEHIAVTKSVRNCFPNIISYRDKAIGDLHQALPQPVLAAMPQVTCPGRPGSFARDLAEMLARIARGRFKLTQQERINLRDLRGMEPGMALGGEPYLWFLWEMGVAMELIGAGANDILNVSESGDVLLGLPPVDRTRGTVALWSQQPALFAAWEAEELGSYAETTGMQQTVQRLKVLELLAKSPAEPLNVVQFAQAVQWGAPMSFSRWGQVTPAEPLTRQLLMGLYWLGVVGVDQVPGATAVALTPLGERLLHPDTSSAELVPDEPQFLIQPNAEVFAPPNLSPRSAFHLRRLTGERKGGVAGVFPLNADSIRRALDSGLSTAEVLGFLETFSRSGLPSTVRSLVETTGRQHGRIRLIPAEVVLMTDDAQLLTELQHLKTVAPKLGRPLTDRAVLVKQADIADLIRNLRQRGHAPLNESDLAHRTPLPEVLELPPNVLEELMGVAPSRKPSGKSDAAAGMTVTGKREILKLLADAEEAEAEVVLGYADGRRGNVTLTLLIDAVGPAWVGAYDPKAKREVELRVSSILWAKLTGGVQEESR